jgi:ribosomal protein S8
MTERSKVPVLKTGVLNKYRGFESYFTYRYMFSRKHLKLKIRAFSRLMSTALPHTKPDNTDTPVEIDPFQQLVGTIKSAIEKKQEIVRIPFSKKLKKILDILERRMFITCDPTNADEDFIIRIGIRIADSRYVFMEGMRVMEMPIFYSFMGKYVEKKLSNSSIKVSKYFETYVVVYTLHEVHVLSTKSIARCEVYKRDLTTATDLW